MKLYPHVCGCKADGALDDTCYMKLANREAITTDAIKTNTLHSCENTHNRRRRSV